MTGESQSVEKTRAGNEHVDRVRDALRELNHLQYNYVTQAPYDSADVRVKVANHMENALVNNGEFAAFYEAGYIPVHVDFHEEFIDLREMDSGGSAP